MIIIGLGRDDFGKRPSAFEIFHYVVLEIITNFGMVEHSNYCRMIHPLDYTNFAIEPSNSLGRITLIQSL